MTFGIRSADFTPDSYSCDAAGISLHLHRHKLRSPLTGRGNASNLLAAATIVTGATESEDACLHVANLAPVPGRLERLATVTYVDVYVGSAGAPSALTAEIVELSVAAIRQIAGSRRSSPSSPAAGRASEQSGHRSLGLNGSDLGILTSGDPGQDHPASIVLGMISGMPRTDPIA